MGLLRVFIACGEEKLRLALLLLLDNAPGLVVAGMADRSTGLFTQLQGAQPEVLLLDWELSAEPMTDLLHNISDLEYPPKVIVLSADPQKRDAILEAGADFVVCKDTPPDELLTILNELRLSETKNRSANI